MNGKIKHLSLISLGQTTANAGGRKHSLLEELANKMGKKERGAREPVR